MGSGGEAGSRMAVKQTWHGYLCKSVANVFWHYSSGRGEDRCTHLHAHCVNIYSRDKQIDVTVVLNIRRKIESSFYLRIYPSPPFFFHHVQFKKETTKRTKTISIPSSSLISIQSGSITRKFLPLFAIHLHYNRKRN